MKTTVFLGDNAASFHHDFILSRSVKLTGNVCHFCNKTFTQKRNLDRHYFLVHENDPLKKNRFVCSKCNKAFSLKQTLQRHSERNTCSARHRSYNNIRKTVEKSPSKVKETLGNFRYILPKPSTSVAIPQNSAIAPIQYEPLSINISINGKRPFKYSSNSDKATMKVNSMGNKIEKSIKSELIEDTSEIYD